MTTVQQDQCRLQQDQCRMSIRHQCRMFTVRSQHSHHTSAVLCRMCMQLQSRVFIHFQCRMSVEHDTSPVPDLYRTRVRVWPDVYIKPEDEPAFARPCARLSIATSTAAPSHCVCVCFSLSPFLLTSLPPSTPPTPSILSVRVHAALPFRPRTNDRQGNSTTSARSRLLQRPHTRCDFSRMHSFQSTTCSSKRTPPRPPAPPPFHRLETLYTPD